MLLEYFLMISGVAVLFTIAAFSIDNPVLSLLAALFWMTSAFSISSLRIYKATSTEITYVTYMGDWPLITLFGGLGIILTVHAVYKLLTTTHETIEYETADM